MSEQTEAPARSRDEILQTHLEAIRDEIHALPGRIFGWFFGAACVGAVIAWMLFALR